MDEKLYQQEFEKANRQEIEEQEARMERMILESEAQEARMEEKIRESEAEEARMQHCPRAEEITIGDILGRIDTILIERDYIQQVIDSINHIPVNESPNGGFDGQARGQALEAIVKCRETTNQRVLALLEKMYDDFVRPAKNPQMLEQRSELAHVLMENFEPHKLAKEQIDAVMDRIEKLLG